jgi:DNA-binding IclR family transcriptional regulator
MYRSAAGRCVLAAMEDKEVQGILEYSNRVQTTPNTIVEIAKLMDEICKIRQNGYAINKEEDEIGITCIATSLSRNNNANLLLEAPYAISVSYPASRLRSENLNHIIAELLKTRNDILSETGL